MSYIRDKLYGNGGGDGGGSATQNIIQRELAYANQIAEQQRQDEEEMARVRDLMEMQAPEDNIKMFQEQGDKLSNLNTRLGGAGFTEEEIAKATDTRNWFEKFTNLPQGQNWFFDATDLINRPGQFVTGLVEGATKPIEGTGGKSFFNAMGSQAPGQAPLSKEMEAAMMGTEVMPEGRNLEIWDLGEMLGNAATQAVEGFSGERKNYGGQIVRNLTMKGKEEDGSLGVDDFVGFGLDMALDPLNWKLFKGSNLTKSADSVADLSKTADALPLAQLPANTPIDEILTQTLNPNVLDDVAKLGNEAMTGVGNSITQLDEIGNVLTQAPVTQVGTSVDDLLRMGDEALEVLQKGRGDKFADIRHGLRESIASGDLGRYNENLVQAQEFLQRQSDALGSAVNSAGKSATHRTILEFLTDTAVETLPKNITEVFDGVRNNKALKQALNGTEEAKEFGGGMFRELKNLFIEGNPAVRDAITSSKATRQRFLETVQKPIQAMTDKVFEASEAGLLDDIGTLDEVDKALRTAREFQLGRPAQMTVKDLVQTLDEGANQLIPVTKESTESLSQWLAKSGQSMDKVFDIVSDGGKGKEFYKFADDIVGNTEMIDKLVTNLDSTALISSRSGEMLNTVLDFGKGLNDSEIADLTRKLENPAFAELVDLYNNTFTEIQQIAGQQVFGNDQAFTRMLEGYTPHMVSNEAREGRQLLADTLGYGKAAQEMPSNLFDEGIQTSSVSGRFKSRANDFSLETKNAIKRIEAEDFMKTDKFLEAFPDKDSQEAYKQLMIDSPFFLEQSTASVADFVHGRVQPLINARGRTESMEALFELGKNEGGNFGVQVMNLGEAIPAGMKEVDSVQAKRLLSDVNIINGFTKDLPTDKGAYADFFKVLSEASSGGNKIVMSEPAYNLLIKNNQKEVPRLLQGYDKLNNFFKRNAVATPGFMLRNETQNITNHFAIGISPTTSVGNRIKLGKHYDEIMYGINGEPALITQALQDGLSSIKDPFKRDAVDAIIQLQDKGLIGRDVFLKSKAGQEVIEEGIQLMGKSSTIVDDVSRVGLDVVDKTKVNPFRKVQDAIFEVTAKSDDIYRIITHMEGANDPKLLARLGLHEPSELVRLVNFDGNLSTAFENEAVKRIIPFYTIRKQNLMFHVQNVVKNPNQYYKYSRAVDGMWNMFGIDPNELTDYERESFAMPGISMWVKGLMGEKTGDEYSTIRGDSTITDLLMLTDPSKIPNELLNATNPMVRLPFELDNNYNPFTGRAIENFEGEYTKNMPGAPKMTKKQEHMLNASGLGSSVRMLASMGGLITGETEPTQVLDSVLGVERSSSRSKNQINELRDQVAALETMIKQARQDGVFVPTMDEMTPNKVTPPKNNSMAELARYSADLKEAQDAVGKPKQPKKPKPGKRTSTVSDAVKELRRLEKQNSKTKK